MLGTQEDKRGKAEVALVFMYFGIILFSYFLNLYFLIFVFSQIHIKYFCDFCFSYFCIFFYFCILVIVTLILALFFGDINHDENDEDSLLLLAFIQTTFQELFSKMDQNADG